MFVAINKIAKKVMVRKNKIKIMVKTEKSKQFKDIFY